MPDTPLAATALPPHPKPVWRPNTWRLLPRRMAWVALGPSGPHLRQDADGRQHLSRYPLFPGSVPGAEPGDTLWVWTLTFHHFPVGAHPGPCCPLASWPAGCTGHSGPGGGGDACTCWMCPLCGHTKQGPGPPPCRSLVWETLPLQGGSGRGPKQPLSPDHVAHSVTCDFPEGLWHFIRMARDGRHRPGRSRG